MEALINTKKENELVEIEKEIAFNIPELKNLSSVQLEEIAKLVIVEKYKDEMKHDVELMNYDYDEMKNTFINNCGRTNSKKTKEAYTYAINNFEQYLRSINITNPLNITSSIADDYIYNLRNQNKSNSTVRQYIGAVSSFYSFLERRTNNTVLNVFRGTKARPEVKTIKDNKFYSITVNADTLKDFENDINTILDNIENKELKAIILIMKNCGLRVGAFEKMSIKGDKFQTITKGSEFIGTLPDVCLKAVRNANLKHSNTFAEWSADKTKNLFKYHTKRLFNKGLIKYPYSAHDIRHYFAITEYNKDKDIYRVSKLLNHSSIAITEKYLKGLNVIA